MRKIKRAQKKLSPVRRKMKAKMKTIDALAPYATDHHINFAFQAIYTLLMALVVQRVLGVVLGALFDQDDVRCRDTFEETLSSSDHYLPNVKPGARLPLLDTAFYHASFDISIKSHHFYLTPTPICDSLAHLARRFC